PCAAGALRENVGRVAARASQCDAERSREWGADGRRGDRSRRCGPAPRRVCTSRLALRSAPRWSRITRQPIKAPGPAQKEDAICPCFESERFSFQSCCSWRLPLPSLAKTPDVTGHAEHVATPGMRAKGVIPARTASPTIISAERLAGECVVTDRLSTKMGGGLAALRDFNPLYVRFGSIASDRNDSDPRRTSASSHVCGRCGPMGESHRGKNRTLRDSISLPQLVFLPRAEIAGNAAIFSPRWTMNAS